MTGRIDSTSDRLRPRSGRSAALVAIAVLIAAGSATTSALAQNPPAKPQGSLPEPEGPPLGLPPVGGSTGKPEEMPPPAPVPAREVPARPAPVDKSFQRVEAEVDEKNPLPGSIMPEGGVVPGDKGGVKLAGDPFFIAPDRMSPGKQRVQLTVDVQASPVVNLNKETTVRLVVFNESNVDAMGVSLVYQLPESMKLNSSTPEATPVPGKPQYQWSNAMLPAGGEWVVILKVTPISTKPAEHAATVTVKTGSKANTTIQEPKLKVEATSSPGRVLKGEQVSFSIAVQNPGTGPARNVIVRATLSSGLKNGSDDIVEQTIPVIGPGERLPLDVLIVDTIAGGEQSCTVDVRSNDVIPVIEDQRIKRTVVVTKPDVAVKLEGQAERFTGQTAEYKLTVSNPGTAPAKKVRVSVTLPKEGGKLLAKPPGAQFVLETRKLIWSIPQLEADQKVDLSFTYGTSTPGLYRANVEVTSGELRATDSITTEVSGIAVLDLQVKQQSRIIDNGKTNYYEFEIKNVGTKEATKLALKGTLNKNLKVVKPYNIENGKFASNEATGEFLFPVIERLGVGQQVVLGLEVQAVESGPGGCKVSLGHAEMGADEAPVEDVISTTVTGNRRTRTTAQKP